MTSKDTITPLYSSEQIASTVRDIALLITNDYKDLCSDDDPIVLIGILKGSYMFLSDLSRALVDLPHHVDFMSVSSYIGTESTGEIKINSDLKHSISGRHVVIVEDISDSRRTLTTITEILKTRNPLTIECCAFLDKPTERLPSTVDVKYIGFELDPPQFVIGYGLDYNEYFRNLPFIGVPSRETILKYATK